MKKQKSKSWRSKSSFGWSMYCVNELSDATYKHDPINKDRYVIDKRFKNTKQLEQFIIDNYDIFFGSANYWKNKKIVKLPAKWDRRGTSKKIRNAERRSLIKYFKSDNKDNFIFIKNGCGHKKISSGWWDWL